MDSLATLGCLSAVVVHLAGRNQIRSGFSQEMSVSKGLCFHGAVFLK